MLTRLFLAALVLGGLAGCTPTTQTSAAATPAAAASGPGVQACKTGMADATGQPASGMSVGSPTAAAGGSRIVVQAPNGRRALCQLDGSGRLVKFDMM